MLILCADFVCPRIEVKATSCLNKSYLILILSATLVTSRSFGESYLQILHSVFTASFILELNLTLTIFSFSSLSVIKDDFRFRDRFTKQNPRKIIHMWAEKELHNLMKMLKFGLRVPEAVLLKKHVLVRCLFIVTKKILYINFWFRL